MSLHFPLQSYSMMLTAVRAYIYDWFQRMLLFSMNDVFSKVKNLHEHLCALEIEIK